MHVETQGLVCIPVYDLCSHAYWYAMSSQSITDPRSGPVCMFACQNLVCETLIYLPIYTEDIMHI